MAPVRRATSVLSNVYMMYRASPPFCASIGERACNKRAENADAELHQTKHQADQSRRRAKAAPSATGAHGRKVCVANASAA